MNNVSGVNAGAVNWEMLFSKLGDVAKTQGVDGKELFTITTNVNGKEEVLTIGVPDDLEIPEHIDEGTLDTLIGKLETSGLGFTDEQITELKDALTALLAAGDVELDKLDSKNGTRTANSILYDIYALMSLMIEVAQSQRDAARQMRTSQNLAVQASIQAQADQQRQAAMTGMIIGIVCGVAGAAVSIGLLAAQGVSAKTQTKIMQESGADAAKMHLSSLSKTDNPQAANKLVTDTQNKVGEVIGSKINADFQRQVYDGPGGNLEAKLDTAIQARDAAKLNVEHKQMNLDAAKDVLGAREGVRVIAQNEYDAATATVAQKQQALDAAKAQEANLNKTNLFGENQGTKNVEKAQQELDQAKLAQTEAKTKLDTATKAVEEQNTNVANAQRDLQLANDNLAKCETDLKTARSDYQKAVTDVAEQYTEKYQQAVEARRNPPEGMSKQDIETRVNDARAEMEMAYAKEAQMLSKEGAMTPSEQKDLVSAARRVRTNSMHEVFQRADFKAAEGKMGRLIAWNSMSTAFWGVFNQVGQGISAIQQSGATAQQGETQREQEMLDQTKDLFAQEQKLIDQVIQLCQAVIQTENQSMRDAIQA